MLRGEDCSVLCRLYSGGAGWVDTDDDHAEGLVHLKGLVDLRGDVFQMGLL